MSELLILEYPLVGEENDDTCLVAAYWDGTEFSLTGKPGTVGEYAVGKFKQQFPGRADEVLVETYASSAPLGRFRRELEKSNQAERHASILRNWGIDKQLKSV